MSSEMLVVVKGALTLKRSGVCRIECRTKQVGSGSSQRIVQERSGGTRRIRGGEEWTQ